MQVYLHADYRQFRTLRRAGEVITVRDGIGKGLVSRAAACPVVAGEHQCQLSGPLGNYAHAMMVAPADRVLLASPIKWSPSNLRHIRAASRRSEWVRAAIHGRALTQVQPSELR